MQKPPGDLEGSDRLVEKVLSLAEQLGCRYLFENPQTGLLKSREVVAGIAYTSVDYCKYEDEGFGHKARKRTAIWTNTDWHPGRPLCRKDCGYCVQRGPSGESRGVVRYPPGALPRGSQTF